MYDLVSEIFEKIPSNPKIDPERGTDNDWILDTIEHIDKLDDDDQEVWESLSLPLQCWYNDNLTEIADAELEEDFDPDETEIKAISPSNYDPSEVELEPHDLIAFDKSLDYLFAVLAKDKWHVGRILEVSESGQYVAMHTLIDTKPSFSFDECVDIRLLPNALLVKEILNDLVEDCGGNADAYLKNEPKEVKEPPAKKKSASVVNSEKYAEEKKAAHVEKVREEKKKPIKVKKRMNSTEEIRKVIINNPKLQLKEIKEILAKSEYKVSDNTAQTIYTHTHQTLRILNDMGITRFDLT